MNYSIAYFSLLMPMILGALVVILVISLRWFSYKEKMALIAQGLPVEEKKDKGESYKLFLAIGLTVSLVGLALSIGLATLGFGPWLLFGLIPCFAGLAMVLASLVMRPSKQKDQPQSVDSELATIDVEETHVSDVSDFKLHEQEVEEENEHEHE